MTLLPFASGPAVIVFDVLLFVFVAGELAIRISTIRNRASKGTIEWGSLFVVVAGFGGGILGRNFTVYVQVRDQQPVVDTGPYRLLRHPSYTGLLMVCLGIGLALGNWLALVVIVVLPTVAILVRIRIEERALLAGIGEPYRRFAATRKRLIPWVW